MVPQAWLDLARFPEVPLDHRPRELFFDRPLSLLESETLLDRGYAVVQIITLPRRSDAEQTSFLLAKAQGLEEGTLYMSDDAQEALWREMQSYGLFQRRQGRMNLNVNVSGKDLKDLLGWSKSRHTLRDNSTVVGISTVNTAALEEGQAEVLSHLKKIAEAEGARRKKGKK